MAENWDKYKPPYLPNEVHCNVLFSSLEIPLKVTQLAVAVEHADCISAEG